MFYYLCALCFIELFSSDEKLLDKKEYAFLSDKHNVFQKVAIRYFTEIGWLRNYVSAEGNINESSLYVLLLALKNIVARFENSIMAESYLPYVKYTWCIIFWDFAPCLTIGACKYILDSLNEARIRTEKLVDDNIFVYQMSINYISPEKFLLLIQETTDLVNKYVTADDLKKDDNSLIDQNKFKEMSKTKLLLLELDRY